MPLLVWGRRFQAEGGGTAKVWQGRAWLRAAKPELTGDKVTVSDIRKTFRTTEGTSNFLLSWVGGHHRVLSDTLT